MVTISSNSKMPPNQMQKTMLTRIGRIACCLLFFLLACLPFQLLFSLEVKEVQLKTQQEEISIFRGHKEEHLVRPIQRLVQIGANDGSNSGNDRTIQTLLADKNTHAILVEPNPQVFDMLKSTIATNYKDTMRIKPINALVCPKGADLLTFFVVSDKLVKYFPHAPHWVRYQLSSLHLESVVTGIQTFLNKKSMWGEPANAAAYVKSVTMLCTPFLSILEQGGFAPQDVDVLAVDTEGHDAKVVTDAFQVPGFLPKTVIFEVKSLPVDERDALLDMLEERGYTTDFPKVGGMRVKCCSGACQGTYYWLSWQSSSLKMLPTQYSISTSVINNYFLSSSMSASSLLQDNKLSLIIQFLHKNSPV